MAAARSRARRRRREPAQAEMAERAFQPPGSMLSRIDGVQDRWCPGSMLSAVLRSRLPAYRLLQKVESGGDLRVVAGPDDHRLDGVLRLGVSGRTGGCGPGARWRVDRAAVLQGPVEIAFEADHGICHLLAF